MLWYVGSKNSDELNVVAWSFFLLESWEIMGELKKKCRTCNLISFARLYVCGLRLIY